MSGQVLLFKGATGLNTVVDPVRLPFDPETGVSDLAVAVNVVVDQSGRVSRRDGHAVVYGIGQAHSLFCDGGDCLFVAGDTLCRLLPDYSVAVVRSGMVVGQGVDYAQVNADIYYTNGTQFGIVRAEGIHEDWIASPYVGPKSNHVFSGPIQGEHIAFFGGRIYLSQGAAIVYSEPFAWSWFDLSRNFVMLDSRVRMMKPVANGMFLSSDKATYFLKGLNPDEQELLQVAPYPGYEWSAAIDLVDGMEAGMQEPGLCALWSSPVGACLGTPTGLLINLTRDKIHYPSFGSRGAGLLRGYEFIQTIA